MVMTKDELLNLQMDTTEINIEPIGTVKIRRLTNKEANHVELIRYDYGQITKNTENNKTRDITYNLSDIKLAEQNAKLACITYSLNVDDEEWTSNEINQLPVDIVEKIYQGILQFNKS